MIVPQSTPNAQAKPSPASGRRKALVAALVLLLALLLVAPLLRGGGLDHLALNSGAFAGLLWLGHRTRQEWQRGRRRC